jgi:hypothetical protein
MDLPGAYLQSVGEHAIRWVGSLRAVARILHPEQENSDFPSGDTPDFADASITSAVAPVIC